MNENYSNFQRRVSQINRSRYDRVPGEFVLQHNGVIVPRTESRLRFGFPVKGLVIAFGICVLVKAYLVWFLGYDLYQSEVTSLLSGTSFEQVAAQILMPDLLTMWVVDKIDWIMAQVAVMQSSANA